MPWVLFKIIIALIVIVDFELVRCVKEKDGHFIQYDSFEEFKVGNRVFKSSLLIPYSVSQSHTKKDYPHFFEEFRGRLAYIENLDFIEENNKLYDEGKISFRLRPNSLADKDSNSYSQQFLRLWRSQRYKTDFDSDVVGSPLFETNPEELDWRQKGFITAPDNQQSCGSCYAFSIAQSIQGQIFKRTGKIYDLR